MASTLLPDQPVLSLLPGETLYSLAARFHVVSGATTSAATGELLFGYFRAGLHHDFTGHVGSMAEKFKLPDPRDAVLKHTVLPIYFPFHPVGRCENWTARLLCGSPSSMKAEMGLLASRFNASHPLKACDRCAQHDTQVYKTHYWHTEHQLPGVTACSTHRLPLMHSPLKISGQDRFAWLMPNDAQLISSASVDVSDVAFSLSRAAAMLWNLPVDFQFDQNVLRHTYLNAASSTGLWDARRQKFDLPALRDRVSCVVESSGIAEQEDWLGGSRGDLLVPRFVRMLQGASPRQTHHPLNHLILIVYASGDLTLNWSS